VNVHHRHNAPPRGARYAIEALWGGEVVGVVIVGRLISRVLQKIEGPLACEVLRCCVRAGAPPNTPSYLYGAARRVWQSWGGQKVITYTLETEPGDSLRGAGFVAVAKTKREPKGWSRKARRRKSIETDTVRKIRWQMEFDLAN
jgi:hypothetical protein